MPLPSFLQQRLDFPFPLAEALAGIPLSNGRFGALLWGEGRTLRLSLSRADYDASTPRLPLGRIDLQLPLDWTIPSGGLHLLSAEAELELDGRREQGKLRAAVLREAPVLCLRASGLEGAEVQVVSRPPDAPEALERLREHGMPTPQPFDLGEFGGWVQERPDAPATCVGWLRPAGGGLLLYVTTVYAENPVEARREALHTLDTVRAQGYTPATLRTFGGWRKCWEQQAQHGAPADPAQALAFYLDVYRQGGLGAGSPQGFAVPLESPHGSLPFASGAVLAVDPSGDLRLTLDGREIATAPASALRPEWLSGEAIRGHRPERRKGMALLPHSPG
jgi:alpha-L-fucosidase 2